MEASQNLNTAHILQAFAVIQTQRADAQSIKMANDFLHQCQNHPFFPSTLLMMYSQSTDYLLQMSCVILLTNVIKRNWSLKKGSTIREISPQLKLQLKKKLLEAYQFHDMRHYKHFNQLIAYLAKMNYPNQYPQLHHFIVNSLTQLTTLIQSDLENILQNNRALAVLSTCKVVMKEYNGKRFIHNKDTFVQYITNVIQLGYNMSEVLFAKIKEQFERGNNKALGKLLQFLRKIDKVILYGLGSMPSQFQYQSQVKNIIHIFVRRLQQFDQLFANLLSQSAFDVCLQIEKYYSGILQQMTRLQNSYPFLYSDVLKDYLLIILHLLIKNVPKANYYQTGKVLSIIVCSNCRPLLLFAYHAKSHEYAKSIYVRKHGSSQNLSSQEHCHKIFQEIYSSQSVIELLKTLITEIMTAPHVLSDHKELNDDYILQDRDIAIVQAPIEASVFQNCIDLAKAIIKCFRQQSYPVIISMLQKVQDIKFCTDRHSQQILINIIEIIIMIPTVYDISYLPVEKICIVIGSVYEARQFNYLSRLIKKYHQTLPVQTSKKCFEILAAIVASPINEQITYETIFQCAIGLKAVMKEMQPEGMSLEVLTSCISNMVSLVNMKQFITTPTLMWPIINLIIKFIQIIDNLNYTNIVQSTARIIVNGLSTLICTLKNQQILVSALADLISMLISCCFRPFKLYYQPRNLSANGVILNEKIINISKQTYILFDAGATFIQSNIHNHSSHQNAGTVCRFWLTMMRAYPTLYEQHIYGLNLEASNQKLAKLFQEESQDLMQSNAMLFIELTQEYFITQLIDIDCMKLNKIISTSLDLCSSQGRNKILICLASLYYSYSILKAPSTDIIIFFLKQLINHHNQISPELNSLRTIIFLFLAQHFINNSAADFYNLFTNAIGNFESWFVPYLWSMHFVTNKYTFKLNTVILLKSIADIGASQYSKLLLSQFNSQLALNHFLKVVCIQLGTFNIDQVTPSFYNMFRFLTKQLAPQFSTMNTIYRKTRLHLSDCKLTEVATLNLSPSISTHLKEVIHLLRLNSAQLEEIIGERGFSQLNSYMQ